MALRIEALGTAESGVRRTRMINDSRQPPRPGVGLTAEPLPGWTGSVKPSLTAIAAPQGWTARTSGDTAKGSALRWRAHAAAKSRTVNDQPVDRNGSRIA
ncbi:MAG TPA: hypothetical protein VFD64_02305 [Gemmatimonadaceae bacterium]|nr:hypothetical protein [Gemmatimonadaceae bacterium]